MIDAQDSNLKSSRTRRNIMKMGAILGSTAIANIGSLKRGTAEGLHLGDGDGDGGGRYHHDYQCLLRGTMVTTADGSRKIEDLAIGDVLPTMFGGMRPIQWIAHYSFKKSDPAKPWAKAALPVRIARSTLARNVPDQDLYMSFWHPLLLDGLLIPVGNLINGTTITLYEARQYDELEYFHVKLESHDVIHAQGAPVETLFGVDESAANFVEYLRLYGDPKADEVRCAPYVSYGRRGQFKSRARSAISPWLDRRQPIDIIRDRLEERGLALSRQLEAAS